MAIGLIRAGSHGEFEQKFIQTICRILHNNSEEGIETMRANGWKPETIAAATSAATISSEEIVEETNLEELAHDQIAQLISARFKGHNLTRLV